MHDAMYISTLFLDTLNLKVKRYIYIILMDSNVQKNELHNAFKYSIDIEYAVNSRLVDVIIMISDNKSLQSCKAN